MQPFGQSIAGLELDQGLDQLALLYLATIQAVAYGTRHIIERLNQQGYDIDTLAMCGGGTKNPVFLSQHANATGCTIELPSEPEAVLLGAATLGSVASGSHADLTSAMSSMSAVGSTYEPSREVRAYHDAKYAVFHQMHLDQLNYRKLMKVAEAAMSA
ncbi:MAG: FGGY-family carbohydrate kinase [Pseudomonadota bacterium]